MQQSIVETVMGVHVPWCADRRALAKTVCSYLGCDSFAVGIINMKDPQDDELLAAHIWKGGALTSATKDKLLTTARKDGIAISYPGSPSGNCVVVTQPESISENRYWWFAASRNGNKAFSTIDQQKVQLLLRRWQARFLMPAEKNMGRIIVGHDNRLIAADLDSHDQLLANPNLLAELVTTVQLVAEQRYPKLEDNQSRDIAVMLDKSPCWVVFRRRRVVAGARAFHWYLEMRPLEEDELIPVGTVQDPRIAKTLAYLHDKFDQVPSLVEVAKHARVSPFYFQRLFFKHVGISPKQYLMRKQLQMAKWLLRAHRVPIGQIAMDLGFANHGHFTANFHRLIGVSPTEYRESFY